MSHDASMSRRRVGFSVLTVSDTRTLDSDTAGGAIAERIEAEEHSVIERRVVADEVEAIRAACDALLAADGVQCVVVTGGTGVAPRDVTVEALRPLFERELPGFGELFRSLSYAEAGAAAMLSRAAAGVVRSRPVFLLPGSPAAVELAMTRLVLPVIRHLVDQLDSR